MNTFKNLFMEPDEVNLKLVKDNQLEKLGNSVNSLKEVICTNTEKEAESAKALKEKLSSIEEYISSFEENDKFIVQEIHKIKETVTNSLDEHFLRNELKSTVTSIAFFVLKLKKEYQNQTCSDSTAKQRIDMLIDSFLQELSDQEIKFIMPESESAFDENLHVVVKGTDTPIENLNRKIKEVLKPGIIYKEKILSTAKVTIFCFKDSRTLS